MLRRRIQSHDDDEDREDNREDSTVYINFHDMQKYDNLFKALTDPSHSFQRFYVWKPKGAIPSPRSGHRAVATTSHYYIWGGFFPDQDRGRRNENLRHVFMEDPMLPELWRYNYGKKKWQFCEMTGDYPKETVASHAMCLYGDNTMIVFGGTGYPFGEINSNDIYVCDVTSCHWIKFTIFGDIPTPVYGSSLIVRGSKLYILFGTTGMQYNSCVYEIDLQTMVSKKLCDSFTEPEDNHRCFGRYRQEVILYDNDIYVFGGGGFSKRTYGLHALPVFDLCKNSWKFVNTIPDATHGYPICRKFHSALLNNSEVFIFGGAYYDLSLDIHRKTDRYVWKLDLDTLTWTRTNIRLKSSLAFHSFAVNPIGQLWVHGGVIHDAEDEEKRTSRLMSLWVRVPKLTDLVWSKMMAFLNTVFEDFPVENLYRLGLPRHLIDRLTL